MIQVLFEGLHENHHTKGYYDIDPFTSSVTLIKRDGINVLIDTGTPRFRPMLLEKLAEHNLKPEDIHYICNTHFHLDHCGNDVFFPNATIMIGRARIFQDLDLLKYPAGIEMFFTPGHGRVIEGELKKELYELVCGEWRCGEWR